MVSWRNPQAEQADWGMDTYARRILDALETVREVSGCADVNTIGFCAGGILMTTLLSHLAQTGQPLVPSASYGVTLLDFDSEAAIGAFSAPRLLELARRNSHRRDHLRATCRATLAATTCWRPTDGRATWTSPRYPGISASPSSRSPRYSRGSISGRSRG